MGDVGRAVAEKKIGVERVKRNKGGKKGCGFLLRPRVYGDVDIMNMGTIELSVRHPENIT